MGIGEHHKFLVSQSPRQKKHFVLNGKWTRGSGMPYLHVYIIDKRSNGIVQYGAKGFKDFDEARYVKTFNFIEPF